MKKSLLALLMILLILTACLWHPDDDSDTFTLNELAKENHAMVGEVGDAKKNYFLTPKGEIRVLDVSYSAEFDAEKEVFHNVIVIPILGSYVYVSDYLKEHASCYLLNESNTKFTNISNYIYKDKINDKLYILFYSDEDISEYPYFVLNGLRLTPRQKQSEAIFAINNIKEAQE